jgi:hypothetical protein
MKIVQEEMFGLLATVKSFETEEEAAPVTNESKYNFCELRLHPGPQEGAAHDPQDRRKVRSSRTTTGSSWERRLVVQRKWIWRALH